MITRVVGNVSKAAKHLSLFHGFAAICSGRNRTSCSENKMTNDSLECGLAFNSRHKKHGEKEIGVFQGMMKGDRFEKLQNGEENNLTLNYQSG